VGEVRGGSTIPHRKRERQTEAVDGITEAEHPAERIGEAARNRADHLQRIRIALVKDAAHTRRSILRQEVQLRPHTVVSLSYGKIVDVEILRCAAQVGTAP